MEESTGDRVHLRWGGEQALDGKDIAKDKCPFGGPWVHTLVRVEAENAARRISGQRKNPGEGASIPPAGRVEEDQRLIDDYLVRIELGLSTTKTISDEFKTTGESRAGILESYLQLAQRDGAELHALMAKRIDRLVETDAEIVKLLDGYEPHILTPEFKTEAAKFRNHAQRYIDRWAAVPAAVKTGQQLQSALKFPLAFPEAVRQEKEARSRHIRPVSP